MSAFSQTYKIAKRIAIAVVGSTILSIGVVMIVVPGPAVIVIPLGLAILGIEFAWARLWLAKVRRKISDKNQQMRADRADAHR